jgi:phage terminase small subunit
MNTKTIAAAFKPPAYLKAATRDWMNYVLGEYSLDQHHFRLLTLAAEAWETGQDARETIARDGPVYLDRFNAPRKHPSVSIQAEARIAFSKLIRELDLDVEPPATASRPPPFIRTGGIDACQKTQQ